MSDSVFVLVLTLLAAGFVGVGLWGLWASLSGSAEREELTAAAENRRAKRWLDRHLEEWGELT